LLDAEDPEYKIIDARQSATKKTTDPNSYSFDIDIGDEHISVFFSGVTNPEVLFLRVCSLAPIGASQ